VTAPDATDADLLAAHVAGDPDAFGLLFARHRDRLWAVALRTLGDPDDAADALQDAMISAFRRASSWRGEAAVTTWLHRVVVNACLDRVRREKLRTADPLPDDLETRLRTPSSVDPAAVAVADERRDLVLAALSQLPAEQRAALVLVDMEGYPVADVAVMLDCAVGTVKSRCARGRARLAPLLGVLREGGDTPDPGNPPAAPAVQSTDPSRAPPGAQPA
jgi:RNA polymerase sigma-70 factor (ECF subfamily)